MITGAGRRGAPGLFTDLGDLIGGGGQAAPVAAEPEARTHQVAEPVPEHRRIDARITGQGQLNVLLGPPADRFRQRGRTRDDPGNCRSRREQQVQQRISGQQSGPVERSGGRLAGGVQTGNPGVRGDTAQGKVRAGSHRRAEIIIQQSAQFGREQFHLLDAA